MKIQRLFILLVLMAASPCRSQDLSDQVLMTVGGHDVTAGEFRRMYLKSAEVGKSPGNIDDYLQQFIIFKLKVADAIHEGIDTTKAFITELSGYRNQLARNYLTDPEVKEKLLHKLYDRSLSEINAWHILVSCAESASPEDTLKAWKKAVAIRERIIKGEPFEEVARGSSDDPSARNNGGNLGYFTVFQMITPFEDAAYSLKPGEISQPVRTPYGYHIIKVADRRPSRGKILVAHIMKATAPGSSEKDAKMAEDTINAIYKQLENGASFSALAKKYSDHKESASNGGKLGWFGTGEIIPSFSEAAFALSDTGKFTRPVRTPYGWHIIKLLDRKAPGSFEESRSFLENRINQSYLNSITRNSFIDKLKKEYNFTVNQKIFTWFCANTDSLVIKGKAKYKNTGMPSGSIYTFAGQKMTAAEFATYIEKRAAAINAKDPVQFVKIALDASSSDMLFRYENSVLETKYPDFRYLMNEFHDGILLFDISGRKVWNKVQQDSAALNNFYEEHKQEYLTKPSITVKEYILRDTRGRKKLNSAYSRYSVKQNADSLLRKKFNHENDSLLLIKEFTWQKGVDKEADSIKWATGTQNTVSAGFPAIIEVTNIANPGPLPLKDVQGQVMSQYQDYLENEWIKQLKAQYSVKIDNIVYDRIRKSL